MDTSSWWVKEWNNIVRFVLFEDITFRKLMELPDDITIIDFIDNYFIRGGSANKILTDEKVRIVYGHIANPLDDTPYVSGNMLSFDIYVKNEELHNVSTDRLEMRTVAIAERLKYLLTRKRYTQNLYRFRVTHESDMFTSTVGYARYNITFSYLKVV